MPTTLLRVPPILFTFHANWCRQKTSLMDLSIFSVGSSPYVWGDGSGGPYIPLPRKYVLTHILHCLSSFIKSPPSSLQYFVLSSMYCSDQNDSYRITRIFWSNHRQHRTKSAQDHLCHLFWLKYTYLLVLCRLRTYSEFFLFYISIHV